MIDQVVVAADSNLNVLYSNYHEKFYERIMAKIAGLVDVEHFRAKIGIRLDRCFRFTTDSLETDPKSMRVLMKMFENFEFDSTDASKKQYYESIGIFDVLKALEDYAKQYKSANDRKSTKQLHIESSRNQLSSMKLIVNCSH